MTPRYDPNDPENIELMKFLIEKTRDAEFPLNASDLAKEFMEVSGSSREHLELHYRIHTICFTIHQMDTIDMETKLNILLVLSVPIDKYFLNELRVDADVEVDDVNRITKYRAHDGSLDFERDYPKDTQKSLINFLVKRTIDAKSLFDISELAEEFKEKSGCSEDLSSLRTRIHHFRSTVHQMNSIDTEMKLKLLFALGGPIEEDFLNKLRMDALVEVDEYKRITKYKANDGSLELEGEHSGIPEEQTIYPNASTNFDLLNFLKNKSRFAESPLNLNQLAEEFKETSGSSIHVDSLVKRIIVLRSTIHSMESVTKRGKVVMLVALGGFVDEDFLNKLRKDAHVEVDEQKRITKYSANDGSLELEGDYNESIPETPESMKRASAAEDPNSSKDASPTRSMKSEDHAPDDTEDFESSTA